MKLLSSQIRQFPGCKYHSGTIILRCVNDRDDDQECKGLTEVDGIIGRFWNAFPVSLPRGDSKETGTRL